MPKLKYEIVKAGAPDHLAKAVEAKMPDMQPHGSMVADEDHRVYMQAMTGDGTGGATVVTDDMVLEGVEPTGIYTDTVTFTVEDGQITAIALS